MKSVNPSSANNIDEEQKAMKVLFIVGKGRSGSTLVDLLLNRLDGWFGMGEFDRAWVAVRDGFPCGCGVPVTTCSVWGGVLRATLAEARHCYPDDDEAIRRAAEATHLNACRVLSYRELLRLWSRPDRPSDAMVQHRALLTELYTRLHERVPARVFVNSSKWPGDPALLSMVPCVEPYAVHLVRDPRGVAHSWSTPKAPSRATDGRPLRQDNFATSALGWVAKNAAAEVSLRRSPAVPHIRMRYEDIVSEPATQLRRVTDLLGECPPPPEFLDRCRTSTKPNHTVGGNPHRLGPVSIRIKADERWRSEMPGAERLGAALLSAPMLHHYGYSVRTPRTPAAATTR